MKTLINRIALFAAGAVLLGSIAYAQPAPMKVTVPFAFETAHGLNAPGQYEVRFNRLANDSKIISMTGIASNRSEYLNGVRKDSERATPSIVFHCSAGNCTLSEIRTATGATVFTHRATPHRETSEIIVPLRPLNAD